MKIQDTESEIVDVNEDDIVLEKEDTAKNLMSPPQVGHKCQVRVARKNCCGSS